MSRLADDVAVITESKECVQNTLLIMKHKLEEYNIKISRNLN